MEFSNVTFASDDGRTLKHTKVFLNKNLFHCYHNNRGYCSFRDSCRYQHYKEICSQTICREKECPKRHPVVCRYKDECKFNRTNNCAFKHTVIQKSETNKDFENKMKMFASEIESLKREIKDLKDDVQIKEKELLESKMEIQKLNLKLIPQPSNQLFEQDVMKENINLKKEVDILKNQNEALKIKIDQKDQNEVIQMEEKDNMVTKYSCKRCCLKFTKLEKFNKHVNEMHKSKLTF